ncbi:zinc-binding protein A33-like [Salvelinus namaycush]|uniref:Zinc-binding protein A33-like n=1 Tax=Salvelinus namaycush TaxID=8040 RepID=A0A8U0PXX9_SALNM|nr:zinc-binding protein A33-like [Salvelinus namaycush]
MSSLNADSSLLREEQFLCSICLNVFTDPVTTPCGHTFCKVCISGHWDNSEICQCLKCQKRFYVRPEVYTNSVIEEISVHIKRRRLNVPECLAAPGEVACGVCSTRKIKALKSCLVCLTSYCETHLEPHQRVVNLKRHKLIDPVENLEDRMCKKHDRLLELFCRSDQTCVCQFCTETDHKSHDTVPIEDMGAHQKGELAAAKAEVGKMVQVRQKKVDEIKHSVGLSRTYLTLCAPPSTKDFSEISVYSDLCVGIVRRAVSNLVEIFKRELKTLTDMEDVTLDSNTASRWICLFDGGKRIKDSKTPQIISDNPERFDIYPMVLGEKGFNSERHYWEVQVGLRNDWDVGVAKETVNRKEKVQINSAHGFFALGKDGFDYKVHSSPLKNLYLNPRPRRIGIYVDYERGQVSFYDVDEKSHIYSFTNQSFTEKLYPYFYVYSKAKKSEALVISCMEDPRARYLSLLQAVSKAKE